MKEKEMKTIDDAIRILNEALACDHDAILNLVETRVECNEALANHPTIQVRAYDKDAKYKVGLIGIINGIFGIDEETGYGYMCMQGEVERKDGITKITKLHRFERVDLGGTLQDIRNKAEGEETG